MADQDEPEEHERRGGRFRRLGRRILGDLEEGGSQVRFDAREAVQAFLEGSDKAKTELVRIVAREVRTYLEELGLKDDIHRLLTNYSLEVHASVNLRRLAPEEKEPKAKPAAEAE